MKLNQCEIGKVVRENIEKMYIESCRPSKAKIGHIVGLTENCLKEIVLIVKWSDGEENSIHSSNIELL